MVVSTPVVAKISPKWDVKRGLFKASWSNIIGTMCAEYYNKYGRAPGKAIKGLVENWSQTTTDNASIELVESFLEGLSDEYSKQKRDINPAYLTDQAEEYFTRVRLERLRDQIEGELDSGRPTKALSLVKAFDDVKLSRGAGVDVLRDLGALKAAFATKTEPLIKMKGALGNFFGETLSRDCFISFEGPEKRGKTTVQQEMCWQGMLQRRKVTMLEVGDETEADMIMRFAARAAMRPIAPTDPKEPVKYPTFIEPVGAVDDEASPSPTISYDIRHFKKFLNFHMARRALKRVVGKIGSKECLLRLYTFPNFTVSMRDVISILRDEERQDRVSDIIDVDYADLLIPSDPTAQGESREAINTTWKLMRQVSQVYHCLFLTATQTKASSYEADTLDMSHFGEDKRKRAHVTGSVGINQTDDEKEAGIFRLNWIVRRKGKFNRKKCVYCASCMDIGNPFVLSTF